MTRLRKILLAPVRIAAEMVGARLLVRVQGEEIARLRVQLADAQDQLALCAAEVQRLRDATDTAYAHRNEAQAARDTLRVALDLAEAEAAAAVSCFTEALKAGERIGGGAWDLDSLASVAGQRLAELDSTADGFRQSREQNKALTAALGLAERARDGWRGRARAAEALVLIRPRCPESWGHPCPGCPGCAYGLPCPGCRGCNAGATADDACGGSGWIAGQRDEPPITPELVERVETAPSWERAREAWRAMRAIYCESPASQRTSDLYGAVSDCEAGIYQGERGWVHAAKDTHTAIDALEKAARNAGFTPFAPFAQSILALRTATPRPSAPESKR